MVIQLDEGLLNLDFRNSYQSSHQDHKREENLCHDSPQFMGEENILSPQNGEDKEQSPRYHKKNENAKGQSEEEWKGGMDIL